jgi:hypothetical protein
VEALEGLAGLGSKRRVELAAAARRRPLELVLRRAGGSPKATSAHVGSRCVGRGVRRIQTASKAHRARSSSTTAMATAAGLDVHTRGGRRGGLYSRREAVAAFLARQGE